MILKESITIKNEKPKTILSRGLLLPKDKVSRNGMLYDWESIKHIHGKLINKSVMYNHEIEGDSLPMGHYTDTIILEKEPAADSKWFKPWQEAKELNNNKDAIGWYYEMDLDADDERSHKVLRGDLNKVSIQVMAPDQKRESDAQGNQYSRAYPTDLLEASIVNTPGFIDTTMTVIAEKAKIKGNCTIEHNFSEGIDTSNVPTKTKLDDEEKEGCSEEDLVEMIDMFPKEKFKIVDIIAVMNDEDINEINNYF